MVCIYEGMSSELESRTRALGVALRILSRDRVVDYVLRPLDDRQELSVARHAARTVVRKDDRRGEGLISTDSLITGLVSCAPALSRRGSLWSKHSRRDPVSPVVTKNRQRGNDRRGADFGLQRFSTFPWPVMFQMPPYCKSIAHTPRRHRSHTWFPCAAAYFG